MAYILVKEKEPVKEQYKAAGHGTLDADFHLPLRLAITTGVYWFVALTVAIGMLIAAALYIAQQVMDDVSWQLLVIAPLLAFPIAVFVSLIQWLDILPRIKKARWIIEEKIGHDLDGDGRVGRPDPIIINGKPMERGTGAEVNPYLGQFHQWIRACEINGTAGRDHPDLGRTQYERWRDRLIQSKWARWKNDENHNDGWVLTAPADEIVKNIN